MKLNFKKRLEKLENVVSLEKDRDVIIRIIVDPDRTVFDALRRDVRGEYVTVTDEELTELRAKDQLPETKLN